MSAFNVSSIKEAISMPVDTSVSVAGKVLEKKDVVQYQTKEKAVRRYIPITVADKEEIVCIRLYNLKLATTVNVGKTYLFMNVIHKQATERLWAISSSQVMAWASLEVPPDVYEKLKDNNIGQSQVLSLDKALNSNAACTIQAKVVQSSPIKYVRDGQLEFKMLSVKDSAQSRTVKLALFGQDAVQAYNEGDVISVSQTYKWKDTSTLSTKKTSKVEFLSSDMLDFSITSDDFLDDQEFTSQPEDSKEPESFVIMGLAGAYVYRSCTNFACKNKKLSDGKCPTCSRQHLTTSNYYCSAIVIVEHNQQLTKRTMFKPELEQLFSIPELSKTSSDDLTQTIIGQIPVNGQALFNNSGMKIVSAKRKHVD